MYKILTIALKDTLSQFRNTVALAMMLAAPLVLASLLGLAFGGESGFSIQAVKVAFVSLDEGLPSGSPSADTTSTALDAHVNVGDIIGQVLQSPELRDILDVTEVADEAAAREAVDGNRAVVAVIVPAGFSKAVMSPTSSSTSSVTLYRNPTQTLGPAIVSGVVQQVVDAFNGARAVSTAVIRLAGAKGMLPGQTGETPSLNPQELQDRISAATETYISLHQSNGVGNLNVRDPQITGPKAKEPGVTGLVLTGMMVFFMLFGGANVARSILEEERLGTLPRLFTTPTPRSVVLAGKMVAVFVTVLAQAVILLLAGWLIFGIQWGALVPVVLLTLAGSSVSAGLAIFLMSLIRTSAQGGAITSGVFVILGLLGGNFVGGVPPGGFFSTVRRFTPNGWLLEGWDRVLRGAGVAEIWLQLLVVSAFAIATFTAGALVFRRRYA